MASQAAPKYPYPANLNVANFVFIKLTFKNYIPWKTQVVSLVESQDLLGFITGETKAPLAEVTDANNNKISNPDLAAWTRTDRLVKAWITANIAEEELGIVVGLKTSHEVWSAVKNAFAQNSQAREFELLLKLQEKKKDSTPLSDNIKEFKSICDQLNAIGKPVPDERKVFSILNGFGPRYESFTTAMLKPPVPSYVSLIPLLQSHDLRNKSVSESVNPNLAFVGQRHTRCNQFRRGTSSFSSRGRGFTQASNRSYNNQRQTTIQSPSSSQGRSWTTVHCQICKKRGYEALKCRFRFDNSHQDENVPEALAALHLSDSNGSEWITDTGATSHMTDTAGSQDEPGDGIGE